MTTQQILVMFFAYSIAFTAAVYFTRPPRRRIAGAIAGGAAAGCLLFGAYVFGNSHEWWRGFIPDTPALFALLYFTAVVAFAAIALIIWRVVLRFGSRGLAVCLILVAIIGPPRTYLVASLYPEWITVGQGIAPIVAVSVIYFGIVGLGYAVMQLVAGPARRNLI